MNDVIFMRGVLAGYKQETRFYKKEGKQEQAIDHLIGFEKQMDTGFGTTQTIYVTAIITQKKLVDAAFMQSIQDNIGNVVEVPVFVGDYKKILLPEPAVLTVINQQLQLSEAV